ncbi:MAG TPA: hypothetical protein PLV08_10105 [Flavobacteriales bacterium]|nr:hypothetical protein [Flavobacteriales bacterium]HQY00115.1 hypothetical protein [Flavobacteriales bacterium]
MVNLPCFPFIASTQSTVIAYLSKCRSNKASIDAMVNVGAS